MCVWNQTENSAVRTQGSMFSKGKEGHGFSTAKPLYLLVAVCLEPTSLTNLGAAAQSPMGSSEGIAVRLSPQCRGEDRQELLPIATLLPTSHVKAVESADVAAQ